MSYTGINIPSPSSIDHQVKFKSSSMRADNSQIEMIHCQDARKLANTIKERCPNKHCTIQYTGRDGTMKTRFVSFCRMIDGLLDITRGQLVDMEEFSSKPGLIAYRAH